MKINLYFAASLLVCSLSSRSFADDVKTAKEISESLTKVSETIKNTTESNTNSKTCETSPSGVAPIDLLKQIQLFHQGLKDGSLNRDSCVQLLSKMYNDLYRATPANFDQAKLKADAKVIMSEIFDTKLELRKNLERMEKDGVVSPECISSHRDILRASIFLYEYVGEHFTTISDNNRVYEGGNTSLSLNPEFGAALELKSGDILVSRGDAFVSGAIARIGDSDGNFSHVAMVYIDPETKKAYTVEAHIEIGVVVAPLEKYLTDGKVRSTVFRQKDEKLAHEAAKKMYERAKKASDSGANIPYDFGMVLEGQDKKSRPADVELFCSEIAYAGYKEASDGKFLLPKYQSGMHMKNPAFKKALGIDRNETFAPSDMELDTRFVVVAEWRNLKKTEKSRMTDAIITRMYEYMDKHDYVLENTLGDAIKRDLAYVGRHLPLFSSLLKDKFPTNMTRSTLGTMIAMDKTAEPLLKKVTEASKEKKAKTGYGFTAKEMADYIDQLREKDHETYVAYRAYQRDSVSRMTDGSTDPRDTAPPESLFHTSFHPK